MALRVLLADESTTIKKVMQLALQDFAVDVKAVHSGLDVAEVARSFQPDIVFADVLLAKRNGYDVTAELKGDANLGEIPVVLMWSSFMDIDEAQFARCKANSRLEKPFDVETLRTIVKEFVPKTQTQRLAHFLKFPADFVEPLDKEEAQKQANAKSQQGAPTVAAPFAPVSAPPQAPNKVPPPLRETPPPILHIAPEPSYTAPSFGQSSPPQYSPPLEPAAPLASTLKPTPQINEEKSSSWNMDSFDPLPDMTSELLQQFETDEDEPVKITKLGLPDSLKTPRSEAPPPATDEGDPWSHQNLSRFKLDIPEQDVDDDEISLVFDMNDLNGEEQATDSFLLKRTAEVSQVTAPTQIPQNREPAFTPEPEQSSPAFTFDTTQPQIDTSGFSLEPSLEPVASESGFGDSAFDSQTQRYSPIGEVLHGDNVISQFGLNEHEEPVSDLTLEEDPNDHPIPVAAAGPTDFTSSYEPAQERTYERPQVPGAFTQMSADELERIIRAQSQETIEELVRKIVPELATEIIKKELERLLLEEELTSQAQSPAPKGKKS